MGVKIDDYSSRFRRPEYEVRHEPRARRPVEREWG